MKKILLFLAVLFSNLLVMAQSGNDGAAHNAAVLEILPKLDLKNNKGNEVAHVFNTTEAIYPNYIKDIKGLGVWVNRNSLDLSDPYQLLNQSKKDKKISNALHQKVSSFLNNSKSKSQSEIFNLIKSESAKSSGLSASDDRIYKGALDVFKHSITLWTDRNTIELLDIDIADGQVNWWAVWAVDTVSFVLSVGNPVVSAAGSVGAIIATAM